MCNAEFMICNKCQIKKPLSEFRYRRDESRYVLTCKKCIASIQKNDYTSRRESIRNRRKQLYIKNREKILQSNKAWRDENKDKVKLSNDAYTQKNKEKIKAQKEKVKSKRNAHLRMRYKSDVNYKITCLLRHRLWETVVNDYKIVSVLNLLGCTINELKIHLEQLFKPGMSWKNYGEWHIDHIRPCASFDLTNPQQQAECFNYKNLQPLWGSENCSKGAKVS